MEMNRIPAAILAAMLATPALPAPAEDPTIEIGATRTLTERTLVCPKESEILRLAELADDAVAYTPFVGEHCYVILPGTVTTENSSWWHSTVCIRPEASPDDWAWTDKSLLKDTMK